MNTESDNERPSAFPRTTDSIWQEVYDASAGDIDAIGRLCVVYRQAILVYVRRWTSDFHQAEDLTQEFLVRMLEKNPLSGFERRETKFRSFLLRCLRNFLCDESRRKQLKADPLDEDVPQGGLPEDSLDRALAAEVHSKVLEKMSAGYAAKGMGNRFDALRPFIFAVDERYGSLAPSLGMSSGNLRKFVHQLRENYHDTFREAVSHIVTRADTVEEMKYLARLIASSECPAVARS